MFLGPYVKKYDSFDGDPLIEIKSNGTVQQLDLSIPHYHLPIYDWVLCMEVLEHIPPEYEDIAVDNLVRHARQGIILSWAKQGQGGYEHVNERNSDYVDEKMKSLCFKKDEKISKFLKDVAIYYWFKWNISVYFRNQNCST